MKQTLKMGVFQVRMCGQPSRELCETVLNIRSQLKPFQLNKNQI